jgi:hypothetical protein
MLTLYLVCFLVGLGLSVVSFVSGLDRINVFDQIFGHAHHGIGAHHQHVHHTLPKHGPKHIANAGPEQTAVVKVSPFNAAAMTAFLAWFGGAGLALHQLTAWAEYGIVASAAAAGLVGGSSVNRFLGALIRREKPLLATTLIGLVASVTSPIREGGTGEIVFVLNRTRKVSAARSDSGIAIDKGDEVVIVRMDKGIAYVSTWEELQAMTPES